MSTHPVQDKNSANSVAFFLCLVSLLLQQNHRSSTKDAVVFATLRVAATKRLGTKKRRERKLYFGSGFVDTVHCAEEVMVAGSLRQLVLLYLQSGGRDSARFLISMQSRTPAHSILPWALEKKLSYLLSPTKEISHRCTRRFILQVILDHLKIKFSIHHCRWKCVSMFPGTGMKLNWRNSQISPLFSHHLSVSMIPKPFLSHLSSSSASSSLSLTDPNLLPLEDVENNQSFFFKKYSVPGGGRAHF